MKLNFVLAGLMAVVLGHAQAATYRWVDQTGKVQYGDQQPAAGATKVEQKKFYIPPPADNADLPYETRLAQEKFPVTLYVASNCKEPCQKARDFLNNRGIPFSEKNVLTQKELDDFKKQSGSDESPTLGVGKTYLKGFQAQDWNKELDSAGYPKNAPYRAKSTANPPPDKSDAKK